VRTTREESRLRWLTRRLPWRARSPADLAKRRVQASLLVLLLLLAAALAAGVLSAFSLYRSAENRYVQIVFPLRAAVRDLSLGMLEEENGLRGYVITGDRRSLAPYFAGREAVEADLAQIARLTRGRPQLASRLDELRTEIRPLHGYYDRLITFVADGPAGRRAARADVLANEPLFARFNRTARQMQSDIDAFLETTRASQRATFRRSVATLVVAGFLGLAIATTLLVSVPGRLRELYLAEEQARQRAESGANAARALGYVSDAVVLVDDEERIRSWNAAAERHFGVGLGHALGRHAVDVIPEYERLVRAAGEAVRVEVDGEERWFSATTSVFEGGHVLTARDVTEAQSLEQARTDFVATASHELRTPLTSLEGMLELLREDLQSDAPDLEDAQALLDRARAQSRRLSRLAADLLDLSRLDAQVDLRSEPVELGELSRAVLAEVELGTAERRVDTVLDDHDGAVWAMGDPGSVARILRILLDNAVRVSPPDSVITVELRNGEHARLTVSDTGPGVPPQERELIFKRFMRGRETGGAAGFGLGLAIGHELAERMGGDLRLEDHQGPGARFTLQLPVAAAADEEPVVVA